MNFRFKITLTSTPGPDLRRILLEQSDHALGGLETVGPTEKAVHEARKSCKRSRAVVALVAPGIGGRMVRKLDRAFRDAARPIGVVRDADVKRATLQEVGGGLELPEVADRAERGDAAVGALRAARGLVEALDLQVVDLPALTEGLLRSWRDTRRAWAAADAEPDGETIHEWRKATKRLLYHVQLLEDLDPPVMAALAGQLDLLQEGLGDHHDLCVLAEELDAADPVRSEVEERARLLEEQTLALGGWILAARPKALRRWLRDVTATL